MNAKVLDTNVLLDRPLEQTLASMDPCRIVIPLAVVSELDGFKGLDDSRGYCARQAIRFLDSLRPDLHRGVTLDSGHIVVVEVNHTDVELPGFLSKHNSDTRILAVSKGYQKADDVVLVTQDMCIRIIADVLGIKSENFVVEHVDVETLYSGWAKTSISDEEVQDLYEYGRIRSTGSYLPNQYLVMADSAGGLHYGRFGSGVIRLLGKEAGAFGISPAPNNREQVFLMDALLDPGIDLVSVLGPAGTGKTLLALAAGLSQVVNQGRYDKLVVTRELIPHGRDIGALPGSKYEKISAWMGSVFDNLQYLVKNFSPGKYDERCNPAQRVERFMEEGFIELEALTYIRGRSIPGQWIIVDEAQNLTKENIKTIITRAGKGTKIIVTGDIQQIDNCRLTPANNGLVTLIDKFKGQDIYAHITLSQSERSTLAGLGVALL
ncbi:MAG TPA: phosphate starvation-inducible protein PhoH [Desulfotomaculum sp.]|nr:phosphate starvation-inducible protein PhoH [Desulfotomaculum sp.]